MKTAIVSIIAFELQCPYCKEDIEYPYTGSLMWLIRDGDINTGIKAGQKIDCPMCEESFKLPKIVSDRLPQ